MWYLIVSIPDLCTVTYFLKRLRFLNIIKLVQNYVNFREYFVLKITVFSCIVAGRHLLNILIGKQLYTVLNARSVLWA